MLHTGTRAITTDRLILRRFTLVDTDNNGIQLLGFENDTAFAFDIPISFTRETWHGRIKACRGIGASSLTSEEIAAFEKEHLRFLEGQPESFEILHSANFCVFRKR